MVKVLIVEDKSIESRGLKRTLESFGYEVPYVASSNKEAVEKVLEIKTDLILIDIVKGDIGSIETVSKIKKLDIPVIFLTAHSKEIKIEKIKLTEPHEFIFKPYTPLELKYAIELAIYKKQMKNELNECINNEFLGNIMENIPNMIFIKSADKLQFEMVNKAGEELLGHSREELVGKTDYDFFPKEEADFFTQKDREVLQNKKLLDIPEEIIETKNFGQRVLHTKKIPIFNKEGNPQYLLGISEDITELKKTEKSLVNAKYNAELNVKERSAEKLESEEELRVSLYNRSLLEVNIDPLFIIGPDGKITDLNKAVELVTGYARDQIIGRDFSDYFTNPDKARTIYKEVFLEGFVKDYPLEIRHKNGDITPVLYNASIYKDEKDQIIGVFAAARDITERKNAEIQIQRLANIIGSSDDAIISKTLEGMITSWNRGAEAIYGYSSEEVVGKNSSMLAPNHLKEERKQITEKIKEGIRVFHHDTTRIRKDGTEINLSISESPLLDAYGNLIGISTIQRDITDRKNAEEALKFIQLYTRSLLEVNIDPLFIIGPDGKITDLNKSVELVTGYSRDQIISTDFSVYFTDSDKAKKVYEEVFLKGSVKDYPLEIKHKNGDITPVLYNASIYKDEKDQVIGVFAAARDITQLKKVEEQLQEHMDNLEITVEKRTNELTNANILLKDEIKERKEAEKQLLKAIKEKEMLLREIHHRVYNNMQIISSLLSLESSQVFDKRDNSLFMKAQDRITSMGLIHGILYQSNDLSSIKFKEYLTSLASQLFTIYASDSNIKFVTDIVDTSLNMETAIPLGLIINELVINSLKYAFPDSEGEIFISLHSKGEEIELIIKDNGVGLPEGMGIKKPTKLGFELVNSLIKQLEAKIEFNRNHGSEFKIKFKELQYEERL
ncbi:MAG: PAS domain S-box protein [Methanobacteriaceae archaeon]|nr:PAS domain S-box protein [Methanobacteriaceae archaeon]